MSETTLYDVDVAQERIEQLHNQSLRVSIAATGSGLGIQAKLWEVSGASRTLIDATNPYEQAAFDQYVGREWAETGHSYCSELGAVALAQRAFFHAQELGSVSATGDLAVSGLGLSAAVSTDRTRRGENKVYVAIRTMQTIQTAEVYMNKGLGREIDGTISDLVGINLILHAAGVEQIPLRQSSGIESDQLVERDGGFVLAPRALAPSTPDDFGDTVLIDIGGNVIAPDLDPDRHVIIPGSFNPMQYGHDRIAQVVRDTTGREPVLEITGQNIEKSPISIAELAVRSLQMRGRWPVILTTANTRFIDKAKAYGGCSFAVGYDTAERIVDPTYYNGSPVAVDTALQQFAENGVIFHVVGRRDAGGVLRTVSDLNVPSEYKGLFAPLPGEFNVSSTVLRATVLAKQSVI